MVTQRKILDEIEAEHALVMANQNLIEKMEERIYSTIGRVWLGDTIDHKSNS